MSSAIFTNIIVQKISTIPAGAILYFAMASVPDGWLLCNGDTISRETYTDLFNALGTVYGAGDGETTFRLPDLRGLFIRGIGTNGTIGTAVSAALGTQQTHQLLSHTHQYTNAAISTTNVQSGSGVTVRSTSSSTQNTGAASATHGTENRPHNIGMTACIKI